MDRFRVFLPPLQPQPADRGLTLKALQVAWGSPGLPVAMVLVIPAAGSFFQKKKHVVEMNMGVSENSVPLNPMVLLIIIPMKNGYFIGNIPYFQTNPHVVWMCFEIPWNVIEIY